MNLKRMLCKKQENFFSLGATLCRAFSRFLLVFLASLFLPKPEFGLFTIFLSIYFFSRLFSENSLNLPFIKFATDGEEDPAVVTYQIIFLKIMYVLGFSMFLLGFSNIIVTYTGLERKGLLFYLPFLLLSLTFYMFVGQVLIAKMRMKSLFAYESFNCAIYALLLAGIFLFKGNFTIESLLFVFIASMAGSALIGSVIYWGSIDVKPGLNKDVLWKIIDYSKFTILSGISSLVILKADVLMIGYFRSSKEVGVYGMALFVNEAVNVVFDSILRICLPKASALSIDGEKGQMKLLYWQSVKSIYLGIIPIVVVIAAVAPSAMQMIYKGKYDESIVLIYLFLASSLVKPVGYVAGVILGATGFIQLDNRICWVTALLNIGCNYMLIPRYGVNGAAVASLFSFIILTILYYVCVRKTVFREKKSD